MDPNTAFEDVLTAIEQNRPDDLVSPGYSLLVWLRDKKGPRPDNPFRLKGWREKAGAWYDTTPSVLLSDLERLLIPGVTLDLDRTLEKIVEYWSGRESMTKELPNDLLCAVRYTGRLPSRELIDALSDLIFPPGTDYRELDELQAVLARKQIEQDAE